MTPITQPRPPSVASILVAIVAASLAFVSALHLTGDMGSDGKPPFSATHAGVAEAAICLVLVIGLSGVALQASWAYVGAIAADVFAIIGFVGGLTFTLSGGDGYDVAYHLIGLPLLLTALAVLWRGRRTNSEWAGQA